MSIHSTVVRPPAENIRLSVSPSPIGRRSPYERLNYPIGTLSVLRSGRLHTEQLLPGVRNGNDPRAV